MGVLPNHVTLAGMLLSIVFLVAHVRGHFVVATVCLLARSYLDILDGDMARGCGLTSKLGGVLDSLSDSVFWAAIVYIVTRRFVRSTVACMCVAVTTIVTLWALGLAFVSADALHDHAAMMSTFPFIGNNTMLIAQLVYVGLLLLGW